jgi:hypothetical protein
LEAMEEAGVASVHAQLPALGPTEVVVMAPVGCWAPNRTWLLAGRAEEATAVRSQPLMDLVSLDMEAMVSRWPRTWPPRPSFPHVALAVTGLAIADPEKRRRQLGPPSVFRGLSK